MESIVFANSPLAEYLEGNGESEASWGIELSSPEPAKESQPIFAPPLTSITGRFRKRGLKPLKLSDPGWSRKAKFYELFSRVVDSRLSRNENSKFLERFRYIIVASQLLNEHVNVSHYDRKSNPDPFSLDEVASTDIFGPQYAKSIYWAGSGGCVLVVSLLFAWVLRGGNGRSGISKGRAIAALLLSMMVAISLFAHARRRWLRSLRAKAIEFAALFVENSQTFDVLASNAVTLIQEVELVSRGYRLSTPLPPITRLERDSQTRRCARLRRSLLSAFSLGIPPHIQACMSLRHLTQEIDLEKYYDIYDIRREDVQNIEAEIDNGEFDDMESLKALKALVHRLHTVRRMFLCCLLALEADGRHPDFNKWRITVEQLRTLGSLVGELGSEIKRILGEEEQFFVPPTPKSPMSPENERYRGQLRKLNSLSQALRGLQAKMHVLREESDRTLKESTGLIDFGPDLLIHYDSIGADLHALVNEWEDGRSFLAMSLDRNASSPPSKPPESVSGTTLVGDTPRNSTLFGSGGTGWADDAGFGLFSPTTEDRERLSEDEQVFEAVAEPRPRSIMTRDERIRKVHEEKVRIAEHKKKAEAGLALQRELQAVLVNRPPSKRKPVASRNFST
ncbi:Mysoin-binding motif of peroxisomes-domain-containing protein [Tuber brumale]|nr:Mysoin-binding motif of peroxisomes-domain-containing protein [Tuber brumale]